MKASAKSGVTEFVQGKTKKTSILSANSAIPRDQT